MNALPPAPPALCFGPIFLCFTHTSAGDPAQGLVPSYHFRIVTLAGEEAGFINFRVGETPHVQLYAGHIGYGVHSLFRGRGYALAACRALGPFVRAVSPAVIITCDPENAASRRTIERLGAEFLEEIEVSPLDLHFGHGSLRKRRYRWRP